MAERTHAETLLAAAEALAEDAPVFAPGRARVTQIEDEDEGVSWWISICEQHDDPARPPRLDRHGHCGSCVFLNCFDKDLAHQVAALLNIRRQLAEWLTETASYGTAKIANRTRRPTGHLARALATARALLGEAPDG